MLGNKQMSTPYQYTLDNAWHDCGGVNAAPDWFCVEFTQIINGYSKFPSRRISMPAKDRAKFYAKLEKASQTVLDLLQECPDLVELELQDSFTFNEPENVDDILTGEFEGLTYAEFTFDRLKFYLETLQQFGDEARVYNKPARGKRKQNENLEETLRSLGTLFEKVSGRSAMDGYYYDESDATTPYKGEFLEFSTRSIWAKNESDFPSNSAIGEAARVAFELRK